MIHSSGGETPRCLCDGTPGASGVVSHLATRNDREMQKMMAMGVLPGTPIRLIRRFPSYVFQIGHSQFAIDGRLGAAIIVRWKDGAGEQRR